MNFILRIKFCCILIMLIQLNSFALTEKPDKARSDTTSSSSLFAGAGFGNNMTYLGSTISENQPFSYGSLTCSFKNEFSASVSVYNFPGNQPFLAFYSGSLNYSHVFNSWFDVSASISGYKFSRELTGYFTGNFIYADATLGIDWRLIYSQISAGVLDYDGANVYSQIRNSRYFQTPYLFNGKLYISFDPYITFLFGNMYIAESTAGTFNIPSFPGKGKGRPNMPGTNIPVTTYKKAFGMVESDFGIPVAFNFERFTFETEAGYILPVHSDTEYPGSKGFVLLLSAYFRIF